MRLFIYSQRSRGFASCTPWMLAALILAGFGWISAPSASAQEKSQDTIMIAAFENLSRFKAPIVYEVGTGNDSNRPKRSFAVDRYSEAPRGILEDLFVNAGLRVVERQRVDSMLLESEFGSKSGVVDEGTAVKIGKMLGANILVIGSILDVESELKTFSGYGVHAEREVVTATVRVRVVEIGTGVVKQSKTFEGKATYEKSSYGKTAKSDVAFAVIKDALSKVDGDFLKAIAGRNGSGAGMIDVSFEPIPANSDVNIDGEYRGGSPLKITLPANKAVHVMIRKGGFVPWEAMLTPGDTLRKVSPELEPAAKTKVPTTQP